MMNYNERHFCVYPKCWPNHLGTCSVLELKSVATSHSRFSPNTLVFLPCSVECVQNYQEPHALSLTHWPSYMDASF